MDKSLYKFAQLLDKNGTHLSRLGNILLNFMKNEKELADILNVVAPFFPVEFRSSAIEINRKGIDLLDEFQEANGNVMADVKEQRDILAEILIGLKKKRDEIA
jgi:hypothetical protein